MRVVIVPSDGMVSVNGEDFRGIDLSFIPSNVHAVQWYGTFGEVEIVDEFGRAVANEPIDSLDAYQLAIDRWNTAKLEKLNYFPAISVTG